MAELGRSKVEKDLNRPWVKFEHLWLILPFLLVIGTSTRKSVFLVDLWWHLKMGEVISVTGSIPDSDLFSFTALGKPYFLQNWLSEILYYEVYSLGGLPLLVSFNSLVLALVLLVIYTLCRNAVADYRWAGLGGFFVAYYLSVFSIMRPQTLSFLFFGVFYLILWWYKFEKGRRLVWLLPFLMVFWANMHGAFVLGVGLIGLFLAIEMIERIYEAERTSQTEGRRRVGELLLVLFVTLAATCLNPQLHLIWAYVYEVATDVSSQHLITEWQPPTLRSLSGWLAFYLPAAVILLLILRSRRRINFFESVILLAFSGFALMSVRNCIWLGLAASPIVARLGSRVDWDTFVPPKLLKRSDVPQKDLSSGLQNVLNLTILCVSVLSIVLISPWVGAHLAGETVEHYLAHPATPIGAVDFMEEQQLSGNVFNHQEFGDYLLWRVGPEVKVFLDGRMHLYGQQVSRDYVAAFFDTCWEERLAKYEVDYILLKSLEKDDLATAARESDRWKVLFEDEVAVLFGRVLPE